MTAFLHAVRFQMQVARRSPGDLLVLVTTPILAMALLSIMSDAGRPDLVPLALLAPVVMALWSMAVLVCGDLIDNERGYGTLEMLLGSPGGLAPVVFGRVVTVMVLSLLAVPEVILVGALFGYDTTPAHPFLVTVALLAAAAASACWATALAALFVLARSARLFQNAITYPVFVLAGALVPVAFLPDWVGYISPGVYLWWASDLMRDGMVEPAVVDFWPRLGAVLGLGVVGLVIGILLIRSVGRRVRHTGQAALA